MKTFIVALPFFDSKMSVQAYRLFSRSGDKLLGMMTGDFTLSDAVDSPGLELVKSLGVEPLTGGLPLFVDVNEYNILLKVPATLGISPGLLVCVLKHDVAIDAALADRCRELKESGYGIAIDGSPGAITDHPLYEFIDYVILNFADYTISEAFIKNTTALSKHKRVVISNIEEMLVFNALSTIPNALFCGSFFSQPLTQGAGTIAPLKINALNLLNQVGGDDFDLSNIADIIGKDPSLSISLLKFINTIMPRKIDSIRSAVAILGQKEVKRWATAAISIQLAEDKPNEITKLSLVRARFAENLAGAFEMGMFAQNLFMLGLFSLLDVILEMPMDKAVNEVALDESVRDALVDKAGPLYKVLEFISAYEHARWDEIAILMVKYSLKLEDVITAFVNALEWYKQLLDAISDDDQNPATAEQ